MESTKQYIGYDYKAVIFVLIRNNREQTVNKEMEENYDWNSGALLVPALIQSRLIWRRNCCIINRN